MNTQNLLLELFVEELPPKALRKLGDAFAGVLFDQLKAQGLASAESKLSSFASPRRLAAHVTAVAASAADKAVSQKLMPVTVGLDASGNATPALLKKLQALGADASAVAGLKRAMDGKAEALFYDSMVKGATLVDGLQKALLESIARLPIPKVMTYQLADGWTSVNFVRPVHRIVALHGSAVVDIKALGLEAADLTEGHRFESSGQAFAIRDADSYESQMLEQGAVIASFDARRAEIAMQLAAAAAKVGGGARAIEDDALLDEVTALVERPNVLICEFEREFLEVPQECLILTMKANQKYFPLLDAQGRLTNKFLVVSNIRPADASAVIGGNERVVRPRLADAKFFFDQDRKKTLASRVAGLDKVVYHNKLGTQGERVQRVRAIARAIGQQLGGDALAHAADTAAQLAKADLVTDMVGEFPELQGIMGGDYARHDGLSEDIAFAIEDHYKPRFAGDILPRNDVGIVVALADKLETLVGMFGIGNLPTGDKDPFALRRAALGIVRILMETTPALGIELTPLLRKAAEVLKVPNEKLEALLGSVREFVRDRAANLMRERGYTAHQVAAVMEVDSAESKPDRLDLLPRKLEAVREFAALPESASLAAANKRISNILKQAHLKGETPGFVESDSFPERQEHELYHALRHACAKAGPQFEKGNYTDYLKSFAVLRAPVDAFFEAVMVMAEDPAVRRKRLNLLYELEFEMNRVADISKLAS